MSPVGAGQGPSDDENTIYCRECGQQNLREANFCQRCGEPLPDPPERSRQQRDETQQEPTADVGPRSTSADSDESISTDNTEGQADSIHREGVDWTDNSATEQQASEMPPELDRITSTQWERWEYEVVLNTLLLTPVLYGAMVLHTAWKLRSTFPGVAQRLVAAGAVGGGIWIAVLLYLLA